MLIHIHKHTINKKGERSKNQSTGRKIYVKGERSREGSREKERGREGKH